MVEMNNKNARRIKNIIFTGLTTLIFMFIIGTWNGPFRWRFFRCVKISEKNLVFFWMNPEYRSSLKIWEWLSSRDSKDGGIDYYPFVLGGEYTMRLGSFYHKRRTFSGATAQNCSKYLGVLRDYINQNWNIQKYSNFVSILNIRYVMPCNWQDSYSEITREMSTSDLFEKVYDNEGFLIYENKKILPYIRPVNKGILLKENNTEGLIHTVMCDKRFNPKELLFITEETLKACGLEDISSIDFIAADKNRVSNILHNLSSGRVSSNIKIQGSKINRILGEVEINMEVNQPGFIVLSEPYFKGWSAYLNGVKVPVIPAYDCLVGVFVSSLGEHKLFIYYGHTILQKIGLIISICTSIICFLYVFNFFPYLGRLYQQKEI